MRGVISLQADYDERKLVPIAERRDMSGRFESRAHPLLEPYVRAYWGLVRDRMKAPFAVTPDCFVELIVFAESPLVRVDGHAWRLPRCFVIPLLDKPLELIMDCPIRCAAIRFHGSSAAFINSAEDGSGIDATPCFLPPPVFDDVVPVVINALNRGAWADIVATFDRTLVERLAALRLDDAARQMANAFFEAPYNTSAAMQEVARRLGRSRRQIERRVRALVKRSPRQLSGLARFQFVRDTLWSQPLFELDDLALEAGYSDQAHLSREFRRYAGTTPAAFRRHSRNRSFSGTKADVAFFQDARDEKD